MGGGGKGRVWVGMGGDGRQGWVGVEKGWVGWLELDELECGLDGEGWGRMEEGGKGDGARAWDGGELGEGWMGLHGGRGMEGAGLDLMRVGVRVGWGLVWEGQGLVVGWGSLLTVRLCVISHTKERDQPH